MHGASKELCEWTHKKKAFNHQLMQNALASVTWLKCLTENALATTVAPNKPAHLKNAFTVHALENSLEGSNP